jgi:hypothetical protein
MFATADRLPHPDRPAPGAALVLVREAAAGVEVFVTRQSDVRGNAERNRWAFPTTELITADLRRIRTAGWSAEQCAAALRIDSPSRALALYAAAARIGLVAMGILLAEDIEGRVATTAGVPVEPGTRELVAARRLSFPQVLHDRDLRFRPDLLRPWLRWINTPWQLRRFDTVYFAAALPHVQQVDFHPYNDSWGGWKAPAEVLAESDPDRSEHISVATRLVCESLAEVPSVGSAMTRIRDLRPITPEITRRGDEWWVSVSPPADPSQRGALRDARTIDSGEVDTESSSLVADAEEESVIDPQAE